MSASVVVAELCDLFLPINLVSLKAKELEYENQTWSKHDFVVSEGSCHVKTFVPSVRN